MPLSDRAIRSAKPGAKARRLFDAGGLYLEISPKGGKWWRLKYLAGLAIMGPVSELAFLADRRRDEAEAIHGRADHWDFERS